MTEIKKIKIGDTNYTLQQVPASWYLDTVDKCRDSNGVLKNSTYMKEMVSNVVVSPRVTVDDFTGKVKVLRTLVKEAEKFIMGEELSVIEESEKNEQKPEDAE